MQEQGTEQLGFQVSVAVVMIAFLRVLSPEPRASRAYTTKAITRTLQVPSNRGIWSQIKGISGLAEGRWRV